MVLQAFDTVSGIAWASRDGGGLPVVLLHGIGSNAASFEPVFDAMPTDNRLIAWNAPGYGGSRPLRAERPTAAAYADRLKAFVDALGLKRFVLVGHSLGTLIAASFARQHPDRVAHLVLAASACGYGIAPGAELPEKVAARITDLHRLGPAAFARSRAPRLVHAPDTNPDTLRRVEEAMAQVDPDGYAQAVHMLASGALEDDLRAIHVPCGFIIGHDDQVTPLDQTLRAARANEAAAGVAPQIIEIYGAGHAVYLQQPAAFCDALISLIGADPETQPGHAPERRTS